MNNEDHKRVEIQRMLALRKGMAQSIPISSGSDSVASVADNSAKASKAKAAGKSAGGEGEKSKPVPLRVIAAQANVTRMTVSLALRGHPSIPPRTRKRITDIAQKLGYQPNPEMSGLMARLRTVTRTRNEVTLALVTDLSWERFPTYRDYFDGAKRQAEQLGYSLAEFNLNREHMSEKRLSQILWSRGIEGVLIFPLLFEPGEFRLQLDWEKFSAATIAFSVAKPQIHRSSSHHTQVVQEAFRRLHGLGYRRIGLALPAHHDARTGHHWRAGFLCAQHLLTAKGAQPVPPLITPRWDFETFSSWFHEYKPDAVLGIDRPVTDWIERCGARVPDDVGYASIDLTVAVGNDVSGMNQNSVEIGAAALDLVVSGVRQHERGVPKHPKIVMIEGFWQAGGTTRRKQR
ncbi:LacI family DNA-binding transcriptional regulator [Geminisphaera colitermitum]|uniref:LacI family DNA-binding transcriptional regulator n=1 Tax=Geminisphaera colitermitum TaxID=1148786 RepID=UPI0012FE8F63|nr:LacI family DNA-binding transcriptional regulator [Geminisphaera colitermitum]